MTTSKFIPKVGEKFWVVDVYYWGEAVVSSAIRTKNRNLNMKWKYNCFRTKREAEVAAKKIKLFLKNG